MFIYDPPAVRKCTVARELAKYTRSKLYHNHVSIQEVGSIFEFGTLPFWRLLNEFGNEMIRITAEYANLEFLSDNSSV